MQFYLFVATVHPLSICLSTFALEEAGPRDYWVLCGDIWNSESVIKR